nr:MAG TPA: hypothetical protein [Caudoviricetes sp.]DAS32667.1 MAG TPA: hypothetical protein [Caudoviricetes sp.]
MSFLYGYIYLFRKASLPCSYFNLQTIEKFFVVARKAHTSILY